MSQEHRFHAVLLFPQAVEVMGEAVAAHVRGGSYGPHVVCHRINASGPFFEMVFEGTDGDGGPVEIEVMIPHGFVRMVLSVRGDGVFGFRRRWAEDGAAAPAPPSPPSA